MGLALKHTERLDWRRLVIPMDLRKAPIHCWFVFPHSFTDGLVRNLIEEWELGPGDRILDPFVGAGTTVLAAKQTGIPAWGVDLSPLSIFVTSVKVASYQREDLREALKQVLDGFEEVEIEQETTLLRRALTDKSLSRLCGLRESIYQLSDERSGRFLLLGLISILGEFSSIRADGGWLRLRQSHSYADRVVPRFRAKIEEMIGDLPEEATDQNSCWGATIGDARALPVEGKFTAAITSPPYPNRHDYSRIFGIELEFTFFAEKDTYSLRHNSIRSHPEAHRPESDSNNYDPPRALSVLLEKMEQEEVDKRIPAMLSGYFEDMHRVLSSLKERLAHGARLALVVGNARYFGMAVGVDEILAEIAASLGYQTQEIRAVRYRGNSAQQMGKFGREESRESCVILTIDS